MKLQQFRSGKSAISHKEPISTSVLNVSATQTSWILKICFFIGLPIFAAYILLANAVSTKGFLLAQEKQSQKKLQHEIELLDIELTIPISLYALESSEQVQEMKTINKQNFVEINNSEVALAP